MGLFGFGGTSAQVAPVAHSASTPLSPSPPSPPGVPVGVIASFTVPVKLVPEFIAIAKEDVVQSRMEPGCLRFDYLQHNDTDFSFFEVWYDQAAADAHCQTPHFKKWVDFRTRNASVTDSLKKTPIMLPFTGPTTLRGLAHPKEAIDHVVVQKLLRPLNDQEVAAAMRMQHLIPGIISITCGENVTMRSAGYNYGWSIRFDSLASVQAYVEHPEHLRFKQEVLAPLIDTVNPLPAVVVDYAIHSSAAEQVKDRYNESSKVEQLEKEIAFLREQMARNTMKADPFQTTAAVEKIQKAGRRFVAKSKVSVRRKMKKLGVDLDDSLEWAEELHPLHWDPRVERRGLGWQIRKLNHVGLVCADIGTSVAFYSDVIGLQQIQRPNFDRYGAWFTMGNVELHLTKGTPPTRGKDMDTDLITHHMSMEIEPSQVETVQNKLIAMGVPFRQNLSVPRGDVKVKDGPDKSKFDKRAQLVQFIIRDPDGYYVEVLAGGDSLINFCFPFINFDDYGYAGEVMKDDFADYSDSHQDKEKDGEEVGIADMGFFKAKQLAWTHRATKKQALQIGNPDEASESLAKQLAMLEPAKEVDKKKEAALHKRRNVYCDICQTFTEEELTECLKRCQNSIPLTIEMLEDKVRVEYGGRLTYTPPAFLRNGKAFEVSPSVQASMVAGQGGGV